MNVLLICGNDHYYGSAQAAINLLKFAKAHCEDVRYIVLTQTKGAINELCDGMGIENYVTGHAYACVAPEGDRLRNTAKHLAKKALVTAKNTRAVRKIEKLVDLSSIDIIHTNIDRDIIGCTLAKKHGIPHVMHLREFATGHYNVEPLYEGQYEEYNRSVDRYIAISRAVGQNWQESGLDADKISAPSPQAPPGDVRRPVFFKGSGSGDQGTGAHQGRAGKEEYHTGHFRRSSY